MAPAPDIFGALRSVLHFYSRSFGIVISRPLFQNDYAEPNVLEQGLNLFLRPSEKSGWLINQRSLCKLGTCLYNRQTDTLIYGRRNEMVICTGIEIECLVLDAQPCRRIKLCK